jgi:hypothetical protein
VEKFATRRLGLEQFEAKACCVASAATEEDGTVSMCGGRRYDHRLRIALSTFSRFVLDIRRVRVFHLDLNCKIKVPYPSTVEDWDAFPFQLGTRFSCQA